jgi:hypothetical protein
VVLNKAAGPLSVCPRDQDRPATSFSQGAKWKALISRYIGTIPLSGVEPPRDTTTGAAAIRGASRGGA